MSGGDKSVRLAAETESQLMEIKQRAQANRCQFPPSPDLDMHALRPGAPRAPGWNEWLLTRVLQGWSAAADVELD